MPRERMRHVSCPGAVFALLLASCAEPPATGYQGYAEAEYVLVAASAPGRLEKRYVRRGDDVAAGAPLFALERENEQAARREAGERVRSAEARLANLAAARRAPELDALRAQEAQAAAARSLSAAQLAQQEALFARGFLSKAEIGRAHV